MKNTPIPTYTYYDVAEAITPSDATRFDAYDALCISDAGTVKLQPAIGTPIIITFATVFPVIVPISTVKVFSTGTSSTLILGLRFKRFISPNATGQVYSGDGP